MDTRQIILQLLSSGLTPQQIAMQMINKNPNCKKLFEEMQSSGATPKDFFTKMCAQKNVNVAPIIDTFRSLGINLM